MNWISKYAIALFIMLAVILVVRKLCGEDVSHYFTKKISRQKTKTFTFEIALIVDPSNDEKVKATKSFLEDSFPGQTYQQWSGVQVDGCPTVNPLGLDEWHPASKLVGIAMAHKRIWEEFLFRDTSPDEDIYVVVFEDDAVCAVARCGDLAIEQIRQFEMKFMTFLWII